MTAASVSPTEIASVLDALPDYSRYFQADRAHDEESPYRLALGRVAKDWGDQLLDIIEAKPTPLNHAQINLVDALLQGIGEIFRALNANGEIAPETLDARTMRALRRCDGELLTSLEIAQRTAGGLKQREFAGVWVDSHAKPLYRTYGLIYKRLAQRNQMLGFEEIHDLEEYELVPASGGSA